MKKLSTRTNFARQKLIGSIQNNNNSAIDMKASSNAQLKQARFGIRNLEFTLSEVEGVKVAKEC